ncbi:MAG: DMT family transporter [Holosporales bacterium]|nr:DMT family transporter [Holosporales bacterium]
MSSFVKSMGASLWQNILEKQSWISQRTLYGTLWTLLGLMLYVFSDAFIKHITSLYSVHQVTFLRALVRLVPLLIYSVARNGVSDLKTHYPGFHAVRLCVNFISTYAVIYVMARESLVIVYVIYYTMPLFIVLFGKFFLKERVSGKQWWAVLMGFMGVIVTIQPTAMTITPLSLIVMSIGIVSAALNKTLMRRLTETESSLTIALYPNISMIVLLAPFVLSSWQPLEWSHWGAFSLMGCIVAFAQYAIIHALRFAPVSTLASLDYTTFVWGMCFDIILWGTLPKISIIIGTLIIIWSNFLILRVKRKSTHS